MLIKELGFEDEELWTTEVLIAFCLTIFASLIQPENKPKKKIRKRKLLRTEL